MNEGISVVRSDAVRTAARVAVVVALVETIGHWAVAAGLGLGVDPLGLALVALAIVVGRPAQSGSAAGLLVAGVLLGDWSGGVVAATAGFVSTAVVVGLWPHEGANDDAGWGVWLLRYGLVASTAVLGFAATSAWVADIVGRAAFSVTVGRTLVTTLPLALLGAPLVKVAAEQVPGTPQWSPSHPMTRRSRAVVVGTVLCWTVGGYVGSFLFRALGQAPPGAVGRRISPLVGTFVDLWGPQGTYAQLLLGTMALAVLGVVFRRE